jgi:2-oxoisovalerate dehydrogenase E2 component (dihydrolipoyl transacylase)
MTTVAMYHSSNPKRDPLVQYKTVDEPELQKSSSTSKPFILADIGEGIAEVELIQWYVAPGDAIRQFDKVCEVQSDKATVDISSRFDGIVDKLCGQKGDVMKVGQPLLFIRPEGSARHDANVKPNSESLHNVDHQADQLRIPTGEDGMGDFESRIKSTKDADLTLEKVLTSPAVRKLGKDYGINLNQVIGTGPQGRIMKSDVEKHMQEMSMSHGIATRTVDTKPDSPSTTSYDQTIPLRGYHRLMASTMLLSLQVPHMCYSDEVNVTELKKFREDLKSTLEDRQVKLSYLPFAIKACSLSMKEYPIMNSTIDMENMSLIFHRDHNIGIAMDSPRGLVVPVIQKCQDLSILEIALNLKSLQEKVRSYLFR